jgi:hypothetical protein
MWRTLTALDWGAAALHWLAVLTFFVDNNIESTMLYVCCGGFFDVSEAIL